MTAFQAEGYGGALSGADFKKGARALRHFDRSGAEWRNLTPPWYRKHWSRRSLDSAYHWSNSHLSPMPACGSARDDDVGGQHWTHLRREGSEGCIERFLRWTGLAAGGFLGLTGLWPEGGGGALRCTANTFCTMRTGFVREHQRPENPVSQ